MPRYFVTMSNEAHGYYYPPREVPFEAPDARAARERSLRSLYCSSDGVRGRDAPVTNLSHNAPFQA